MKSEKIVSSLLNSDKFSEDLKKVIKESGLNVKEFCKLSGIPLNTLYKIISNEEKDFRVSTLKKIYRTFKKLEQTNQEFIAVVAPRLTLDSFNLNEIEVKGKKIKLKGYDVSSITDLITQGVRAEKEGAKGIICGPLAAKVISEVVDIPISCLTDAAFDKALENIKSKL